SSCHSVCRGNPLWLPSSPAGSWLLLPHATCLPWPPLRSWLPSPPAEACSASFPVTRSRQPRALFAQPASDVGGIFPRQGALFQFSHHARPRFGFRRIACVACEQILEDV